jgi:RNA polymerase sigma factor (sigma-70 family)
VDKDAPFGKNLRRKSKIPRKGDTPERGCGRIFKREQSLSSVAETTAEARLYEQHSDVVLRYCLRTLGSREDAEDAAQSTFFQAVRALRRGVVPVFEQAWLLTIAKNECRSRHRANGRRRRLELVRDPQTLEEIAEAPSGGDGALIGVQSALGRLPETQRRALLLREWQGCSYAEIAHELGTTVPAVEALLFRARRAVARELGEEKRSRRHALDLASLLTALKSLLGGGAAVKAAAGLAAVATVGVVAGDAEQKRLIPPKVPAQEVSVGAVVPGSQSPVRPASADAVVRPSTLSRRGAKPASRGDRSPVARPGERSSVPRETPVAPGKPASPETTAPGGASGSAPDPAAAAPPQPAVPVPVAPDVPQPPAPPLVQLPPLPELPPVQEVPIVGELPIVEDLPPVSELPVVEDLPVDLPLLP